MKYYPEGSKPQDYSFTAEFLQSAWQAGRVLEARALQFNADKELCFMLGSRKGVIPLEECCADNPREVAALACVGRMVCFIITDIPQNPNKPILLSRAQAQQICKAHQLDSYSINDVITCRVTHAQTYGAFCDIGCGIAALLPIDCMSVSRISHPLDRVYIGQEIRCLIKSRDEQGRFVLSLKELLGSWQENAAHFTAGETVIGVVRSVESYGIFIELAPNLCGLCEYTDKLHTGQLVSVYIKSILPEKHKIKLAVLRTVEGGDFRFPLTYYEQGADLEEWNYLTPPQDFLFTKQ